jgi:hypothetical protein
MKPIKIFIFSILFIIAGGLFIHFSPETPLDKIFLDVKDIGATIAVIGLTNVFLTILLLLFQRIKVFERVIICWFCFLTFSILFLWIFIIFYISINLILFIVDPNQLVFLVVITFYIIIFLATLIYKVHKSSEPKRFTKSNEKTQNSIGNGDHTGILSEVVDELRELKDIIKEQNDLSRAAIYLSLIAIGLSYLFFGWSTYSPLHEAIGGKIIPVLSLIFGIVIIISIAYIWCRGLKN